MLSTVHCTVQLKANYCIVASPATVPCLQHDTVGPSGSSSLPPYNKPYPVRPSPHRRWWWQTNSTRLKRFMVDNHHILIHRSSHSYIKNYHHSSHHPYSLTLPVPSSSSIQYIASRKWIILAFSCDLNKSRVILSKRLIVVEQFYKKTKLMSGNVK